MRFTVIVAAFLLTVLTACAGQTASTPTAEPTTPPPQPTATEILEIDAERIAQGVNFFRENYCGVCHTLTIANTRGEFAPPLDNVIDDAVEHYQSEAYTGNANTIETYLYESITTPDVYIIPDYAMSPHPMPSFRHLDDSEIQDIIYMLMVQNMEN